MPAFSVLNVNFLTRCALAALACGPWTNPAAEVQRAVGLPGTRIEMPWEQFERLALRKPDTVYAQPASHPPSALALGAATIEAHLADSSAACRLTLSYRVLSPEPWSSCVLIGQGNDVRFTDVTCEPGDFLALSDSGCVIIARGGQPGKDRTLRCSWTEPSRFSGGLREVGIPCPRVLQGTVTVTAPRSFADVSSSNATVVSRALMSEPATYAFSLPSNGARLNLTYAPPVRLPSVKKDTSQASESDAKTAKSPLLSSVQETAVFFQEDHALALTCLHLSVARAPVKDFAVALPPGLSLLRAEGGGISRWFLRWKDTLRIELTFELTGAYLLSLTGELPADSGVRVPSLSVAGASRSTGRFAVGLTGAGEVRGGSLTNCVATLRGAFINELSPAMAALLKENTRSANDLLAAGAFNRVPFDARFTVQQHPAALVADAIADSGVIVSALSEDWKLLTHVTYRIRQRDRQFISLRLPDATDLWSVQVNGTPVAPFLDDSGNVKISLQRYADGAASMHVNVTYFRNLKRKGPSTGLLLKAPVPDIPVQVLTWSLFYPDQWRVGGITGDFTTSEPAPVGRRPLSLGSETKIRQYDALVVSNKQRQGSVDAASMPVMPDSPRHIYGRRILVVNEHPALGVRFVSVGQLYMTRVAALIVIAAIAAGLWFGIRRRSGMPKR